MNEPSEEVKAMARRIAEQSRVDGPLGFGPPNAYRAALAAIIETQRLDAELADTFGDEGLTDAGEGGWHIARMIRTGDHYGKDESHE